jgi:hypothetical protein
MSMKDELAPLIEKYGITYLLHGMVSSIEAEKTQLANQGKLNTPKAGELIRQIKILRKAWKAI